MKLYAVIHQSPLLVDEGITPMGIYTKIGEARESLAGVPDGTFYEYKVLEFELEGW
jgi:hypothetical protein